MVESLLARVCAGSFGLAAASRFFLGQTCIIRVQRNESAPGRPVVRYRSQPWMACQAPLCALPQSRTNTTPSDILPPADSSAPSQSPSPCSICRWSHRPASDPEGYAHRRSYRSKDATQFQTSEDLRSEHPILWRRRRRKRREPFVTWGFWNFKSHRQYAVWPPAHWSIRSGRGLQGSLPCASGESMLYGAQRGGLAHHLSQSLCAANLFISGHGLLSLEPKGLYLRACAQRLCCHFRPGLCSLPIRAPISMSLFKGCKAEWTNCYPISPGRS